VDAVGAVALAAAALALLVWPILEGCATILLQASPAHLRDSLANSVRAVLALDGVLEVKEPHFWAVGATDCVASLHVRLRHDASEEEVRARVRTLFPAATHLTVQIDRDEWLM
jgi:Co/Zn/Cd efflux system component